MQGPASGWRMRLRPPRLEGWGADGEAAGVGRGVGADRAVDPEGAPAAPVSGRKRLDDRRVLTGILFVLQAGIPWEYLPKEMGCGSGMTCWRRLQEWQQASSPTGQALRRPCLPLARGPSRTPPARHPGEDRPAEERAWLRAWTRASGGRAHDRLATPVPPLTRPLRASRRHPRSLPRDRLQPDLPQAVPRGDLILIGALSRFYTRSAGR